MKICNVKIEYEDTKDLLMAIDGLWGSIRGGTNPDCYCEDEDDEGNPIYRYRRTVKFDEEFEEDEIGGQV